jgi:iron-sulfur cluster repair protein YtfE (RIC family)
VTVVQSHGKAHPATIEITNLWPGVQGELAMHMQKEELMPF